MVSTRNSGKKKRDEQQEAPAKRQKTRNRTSTSASTSKTKGTETTVAKPSLSRKRVVKDDASHDKKTKGSDTIDIEEVEAESLKDEAKASTSQEGKGKQVAIEEMDIDEKEEEEEEEEEKELDTMEDEDEDEDDSIDWETIQLPPKFDQEEQPMEEEQHRETYNDVEIVMEAPRPVLKKSHWEMAYQRNLRDWMHNCHVVMLVAHFKLRNSWCSDDLFKNVCSSIVPSHAKNLLSKDPTAENLMTGIKWLLEWWNEYFTITGPGLSTRPYTHFVSVKEISDVKESNQDSDYIKDFEAFVNLAQHVKLGTRDTSAQIFVAMLRACGLDSRLVCSLQSLPYKIVPHSVSISDAEASANKKEQEEEEDKPVRFKFRANKKNYVDLNIQLKQPKAKPPTVWTEVYCPETEKWICVDPIRGHIDQPGMMEPAKLNRGNHISLILAFDEKKRGNVTDVTSRYTTNLERALRLRERPLTKREKEGGLKLWSKTFLHALSRRNKMGHREHLEQASLQQQKEKQSMPTAIGNFKNHPVYALERHLKKFEVLYPREPVLGSIRGEKIFPRYCVKNVSTADTWRKAGKEIKMGEQPIKMVKANAVTMEKKRLKEQAKQEGHDLLVACYGEWQTKDYVPPSIKDGKIPKNQYGTIDLFKPTMLPKGAAHIPMKGVAKLAKKLGIDYAEAVVHKVDFEFVKMRAVPVIEGIVVAECSKDLLLETWEEHEHSETIKTIAKQEKEIYVRWRKLIKGLLIKARVDHAYGKKEDKWACFNKNQEEQAGYIPEEEKNRDDLGGEFISEDE